MSDEKTGMPVFSVHTPETADASGMTSEQRAAVETGGGQLLVSASAGSGKTSVLTRRVVRCILDGRRADEMLIVTFTNAAAREMRTRIAAELKKEHDRCADVVRRRELRRQLTLLPQARICTMDSFCGDFVRTNFQRLGVSPDYRIVLGPELTLLRRTALSSVFDEMYAEADEGFVACVDAFSSDRDDAGLFELVLDLADKLDSEPYPERTLKRLEENFDPAGRNATLEKSVWYSYLCGRLADGLEASVAVFEVISRWAHEQADALGDKIVQQREAELEQVRAAALSARNGVIGNISFVRQASLSSKNENYAVYQEIKEMIDSARADVKALYRPAVPSPEEYALQLKLCHGFMHSVSEIIRRFSAAERELRRRRNILTFSDTSHLTLSLLVDSYDETSDTLTLSQYAREYSEGKWGRPVSEVMIDEYQDTNLLQSLIFRALSDGGRKLFCVGDLKQSVYRFRQARPDLFAAELDLFNHGGDEFPQVRFLTRNFRSSKGVLGFVNMFFAHVMSRKLGGANYDDTQWAYAGAAFPDNDYATELLLIDKDDHGWDALGAGAGDEEDDRYDDEDGAVLDPDMDYREGLVCARRIKELIASGRTVYNAKTGKSREISYDDIVLLLRHAKSHADAVARALSDSGIPVYSSKAKSYFDRYEVRFVLAFLRAVDNPYLDVPLAAALRSPIFCFTAQELCDLRESGGGCLYDRLKASGSPKARSAYETLSRYRSSSRGEPVYRLIWNMYSEFSLFSAVGAMSAPGQRAENLRLIYRHACSYEDSALRGLYGFLCYMERVEKQEKDEEGENPAPAEPHVTISTIHAVKGLEYPFVFLLSADRMVLRKRSVTLKYSPLLGAGMRIRDHARRMEYDTFALSSVYSAEKDEELSELLRLLYVALTRAKEKLFIVGRMGITGDGAQSELERLIRGLCVSQDMLRLPVSDSAVRSCRSALNMIIMTLLRHPSGRAQLSGLVGQLPHSFTDRDKEILYRSTMSDRFADDGGAPGVVLRICPPVPAEAGASNTEPPSVAPVDISVLDYVYPGAALAGIPAKVSVSDLKGLREMDEDSGLMSVRAGAYDKPAFVRGALTAAQRGTAVHKFVQYLIFGDGNILAQLEHMVARGTLTSEEAQAMDVAALERFTKSGLYARIAASPRVEREYRFLTQVPASQYDPRLDGAAAQRRIMLQGVIDLFFAEEDGLTLVDYKTDRSTDENYYREHYALQLRLYAQALEGLTGERVARRVVYSFSASKEIEL